jgi:nitrogen regulatory protein P-II 1
VKKIEAIVRPEKLDEIKEALASQGCLGLNIVHVTGRGAQKGIVHVGRGGESFRVDMLPKVKVEVVVHDNAAERVVQAIMKAAWTGNIGDGKIFILPVEDVVRVRTGERGDVAL